MCLSESEHTKILFTNKVLSGRIYTNRNHVSHCEIYRSGLAGSKPHILAEERRPKEPTEPTKQRNDSIWSQSKTKYTPAM